MPCKAAVVEDHRASIIPTAQPQRVRRGRRSSITSSGPRNGEIGACPAGQGNCASLHRRPDLPDAASPDITGERNGACTLDVIAAQCRRPGGRGQLETLGVLADEIDRRHPIDVGAGDSMPAGEQFGYDIERLGRRAGTDRTRRSPRRTARARRRSG
ncbi:MAG: hypothetical protein U0599_03930 [Vicinamibacteria bacterium]